MPGVEDCVVWLDAQNSWLDHTPRVLADLMVEVLVFSARPTGDDWLNVALLSHTVTELMGII